MEHLKVVLRILLAHQFKVNQKKCALRCLAVECLRHVVPGRGVEMDPTKVSSVLQWPTLKNLKEVRGFLGLIGYFQCFIRDYGRLVQPLTTLLKKEHTLLE